MTLNSWQPPTAVSQFNIDHQVLQKFISLSEVQLNSIDQHIDNELIKNQQPLMKLGKEAWSRVGDGLNNEEIIHLIRFFTKAESQLPGWEAGAESPVIWLVKVLRKRKAPPSKELLLWIRTHSDNRFLPNGAL